MISIKATAPCRILEKPFFERGLCDAGNFSRFLLKLCFFDVMFLVVPSVSFLFFCVSFIVFSTCIKFCNVMKKLNSGKKCHS